MEWVHAAVLSSCWLADARHGGKPRATNSLHGLARSVRDLGLDTEKLAPEITAYDPDPAWDEVTDDGEPD